MIGDFQNGGNFPSVPSFPRINFVDAPFTLFGPRWVLFTVRDELGSELLKVENQSSAVPGAETGYGLPVPPKPSGEPNYNPWLTLLADPVVGAVTELYATLQPQLGKEGVDRAIDLLDGL